MAQPIFIDNEKFKDICETIGYTFNNPYLLEQAFIRKSYSIEHPGVENNEVLEFLGDKVLDYVIVWSMSTPEWYGSFTQSHQFHSKFDEGKLTNIKKNLVDKEMLAKRMAILDLSKYLVMGNGDIQNNAQNDPSVLEDLFEAIYDAWVEKVNVLNFDELKASWANIKSNIIDKIYFFDIYEEILDVYLDEVITPEFWKEFREYINDK